MRYIEGQRAGQAIVWEVAANYCRENIVVANTGPNGIEPGTVIADADGDLIGMVIHAFDPNEEDVQVAVVANGPAELRLPLLVFPTVTNAVDGANAGSDNTAENAAATAALRASLIDQMKAKLIKLR